MLMQIMSLMDITARYSYAYAYAFKVAAVPTSTKASFMLRLNAYAWQVNEDWPLHRK